MSGISLHNDHPVDELPDYVLGRASDAEAIESHLARCETCRVEVEVIRALGDSGPAPLSAEERKRLFEAFSERRMVAGSIREIGPSRPRKASATRQGGLPWRTTMWRAAASIAFLLTSIGVWQTVQNRPGSSDWSPDLALEGWGRDLVELDIGPADVRVALGLDVVDQIAWEDLEGFDPYEVQAPWEEN